MIRRISSLKNLGVFPENSSCAAMPDLLKYNLIYGFNGSGKTTLSRLFASLEAGALRPELPPGGAFEIELNNGAVIKSSGPLDTLKGRILVFNDDFVEENLRWKEGRANPVFYIGRAQADLANTLEERERQLITFSVQRTELEKDLDRKERAFTDYKRDAARLIAEQLGLGRRYDATNLVEDYTRASYGSELSLSDDDRRDARSVINQDAPLPKRTEILSAAMSLGPLVRESNKVLSTSLAILAVGELQRHDAMLRWVKEGVDYHEHHNLSTCLLCGNGLSAERIATLHGALDANFEALLGDISKNQKAAQNLIASIAALKAAFPSVNDISKDLQGKFATIVTDLSTHLARGTEMATSLANALGRKAATPNITISPSVLPSEEEALRWDKAIADGIAAMNGTIVAHNAAHDSFTQTQETARSQLKNHFLAEGQTAFRQHDAEYRAANSAKGTIYTQQQSLQAEIERLKQQMRQHGPAAELINRMIRSYLGHSELEIGTLDSGYEIRRNGKSIVGGLSEGEKTAIALCYFLSSIEAEGRRARDLVVVIVRWPRFSGRLNQATPAFSYSTGLTYCNVA